MGQKKTRLIKELFLFNILESYIYIFDFFLKFFYKENVAELKIDS